MVKLNVKTSAWPSCSSMGFMISVIILMQYPSYAALADSETDMFDTRELKLHLSYGLGHSVSEVEFRPRGSITVRNFKGPKYSSQQDKVTPEELESFEKSAREDAFYFLSVSIKFPSGEKVFQGFTPVRSLLDAGLSDQISIHLTPSGEIFSIAYSMTINNFLAPQNVLGQETIPKIPFQYNTTLTVHSGEVGPVPDTAPYLEKLEMERIARERGDDGRDNRSFLAKYWMYIVPVALLVLLSGASNQEGGS